MLAIQFIKIHIPLQVTKEISLTSLLLSQGQKYQDISKKENMKREIGLLSEPCNERNPLIFHYKIDGGLASPTLQSDLVVVVVVVVLLLFWPFVCHLLSAICLKHSKSQHIQPKHKKGS